MRRDERSIFSIPRFILVGFILALALQILMHQRIGQKNRDDYVPLATPYSEETYRGLSMGSEQLLSYLLAIRLQLHDNQAVGHIRYHFINYDVLIEWLDNINRINPVSEYPVLLAARIYSQTSDKQQLRKILEHVDKIFTTNPQLFWRYQAESTVIAKHRLGDLEFALDMAENLFRQPQTVIMPQWARDMHFLLLADLNEYQASIAIIQAMLKSDVIEDPDEKRFLLDKLLKFQQKLSENEQVNQ